MASEMVEKRKLTLDECSHTDGDGVEFWYAREIMGTLGYDKWQNFAQVIAKAIISLESTETPVQQHFADVSKSIPMPKGGFREIDDHKPILGVSQE